MMRIQGRGMSAYEDIDSPVAIEDRRRDSIREALEPATAECDRRLLGGITRILGGVNRDSEPKQRCRISRVEATFRVVLACAVAAAKDACLPGKRSRLRRLGSRRR